jgi:hypothetical protein
MNKNTLGGFAAGFIGSAAVIALGVGSASAAGLIGHNDIKPGAVHRDTLSQSINTTLGNSAINLRGSILRIENYENGGTGSATVACANDDAKSQKYIAISGGVLTGNLSDDQGTDKFGVLKQGPGRMNWDTNTPKPGRLDGWIVAGNTINTTDLRVWALCVPRTSIKVQQVDLDN